MDAPTFENIVTSSQNSSAGVLLHLPEPSTSHLDIWRVFVWFGTEKPLRLSCWYIHAQCGGSKWNCSSDNRIPALFYIRHVTFALEASECHMRLASPLLDHPGITLSWYSSSLTPPKVSAFQPPPQPLMSVIMISLYSHFVLCSIPPNMKLINLCLWNVLSFLLLGCASGLYYHNVEYR